MRTGSGTRSTGVPTDRSTRPSGCAAATVLAGSRLSHGKSGSRVTGDVPAAARHGRRSDGRLTLTGRPDIPGGRSSRTGQFSSPIGGSAATNGSSLLILPTLDAPPGEPRSSKKSTFARV